MNDEYIIDNSEWDEEKDPEFNKNMQRVAVSNSKLPDGLEIQETVSKADQVGQDIVDTAKQEGLDTGEEYIGGKGAKPNDVIDALVNEAMPEGAQKAYDEYEDKKVNSFRKVVATRDLLFSRLQKLIDIPVEVATENGETVDMIFKIKRLSEAESNHLLNRELIGKDLNELTEEEYQKSMAYRRKTLALAVVEPKLTAQEWAEDVDNAITLALFEKVNKAITDVNDAELFQ